METEDNNYVTIIIIIYNINYARSSYTHHFANKSDFPHPAAPLTRNGTLGAVQSDTCSFKSL